MRPLATCPLCRAADLESVASFRFERPAQRAAELAACPRENYVALRLAVMFEDVLRTDATHHDLATVQCRQCSFVGLDPAWDAEDIARKYARLCELLPPPDHSDHEGNARIRARAARVHRLVRGLRRPAPGGDSVLDVGGSSGYALGGFLAAGDRAAVLDFDPGSLAPGVRWAGEDFAAVGEERFDVVLSLHTLEHVTDPRGFMAGLAGLLAPGGLLYVEVPLGTLFECKGLAEPLTHVGFFCEESLHRAFVGSGLTVRHASTELQWVVTSKSWCVNMVGSLDGGAPVSPRPAHEQESLLRLLATPRNILQHPYLLLRAWGQSLHKSPRLHKS